MFSTFLDKVTGYFDKRAVVSAFFPSLVFWGLVVAAFIVLQMNWQVALTTWDKLSISAQFLLFLAYFIWVTFWSFLTINFRQTYTRLFEGYWSDTGLFGVLRRWRRGYWQKRWKRLDDKDQELAQQQSILYSEQYEYKRLKESLMPPPAAHTDKHSSAQLLLPWTLNLTKHLLIDLFTHTDQNADPVSPPPPPPDTNNVGQELDNFLAQHQPIEASCPPIPKSLAELQECLAELQKLGREARNLWQKSSPWLIQPDQNSPWAQRSAHLQQLMKRLSDEVDHQLKKLQVQRDDLYRNLSLYYPPQDYIMPTRLGNVLKAAELYSWERYQIDSVVIWSRLESDIPDAFSAPLQDAKTSLDLITTLAAFLLFFGVPLACWVALRTAVPLPWWIPLLLALIAFLPRLYIPLGLALVSLILSLLALWLPLARGTLLILDHFQVLILGLLVVSFLFWLSYTNAVQAALAYGEKIRAAIDLYRWSVLKDLHLQTPKDLEEERTMWKEVNSFLYRSLPPDQRYYRYAQEEKTDVSSSSKTEKQS